MPKKVLFLSAKNLKDKGGMFGKSDPYAKVTMVIGDGEPELIGETEVVKNNLSPSWFKSFVFDYEKGEDYAIHVNIFDKNSKKDDTPMGGTFFDIDAVVEAEGGRKTKPVRGGGECTVIVEDVSSKGLLILQLNGRGLKNVEGMFKKSDPFYELLKKSGSNNWAPMYRSEFIKDNLDPLWNEMKCDLNVLSNDDTAFPIKIAVYDYESSGDHEFIGSVETSIEELISAKRFGNTGSSADNSASNFLALQDKKGKDAGSIVVIGASIKEF